MVPHCGGMIFSSVPLDEKNKIQSRGIARKTRQNALAVGPTSETRTQIGDSAMHVAPANSAINGGLRTLGW
jgi:hypothetical protein